jgi:hypothetical protein
MKAGDQRRAAPEHRRRLVGRRASPAQRLVIDGGHRADDATRRRRGRDALYRLLEEEVFPPSTIARRRRPAPLGPGDGQGRRSGTVAPRFSPRGMVKEYCERMYAPAARESTACGTKSLGFAWPVAGHLRAGPWDTIVEYATQVGRKARCALCGAKEVSSRAAREILPRLLGQEDRRRRNRRREFALKRYIPRPQRRKYLIYHSTLKRPCGQLIVVDDGYGPVS